MTKPNANPDTVHANHKPFIGQRCNISVIQALISGAASSAVTTILYQPLELLKTRIQIRQHERYHVNGSPIIGRTTRSALWLSNEQGIKYLWRGTGASLIRAGPGIGFYYVMLNILQTEFSEQTQKPDSAGQAFCFGLVSRLTASLVLLPVSVVKVRYESGNFFYSSLGSAIRSAYLQRSGWTGAVPTLLRDSIFSATYYMLYTSFKSNLGSPSSEVDKYQFQRRGLNFFGGIMSGLVASLATNPVDVLKTNMQAKQGQSNVTMRDAIIEITNTERGYLCFFDGLVPRTVRRTLMAATTWTLYELITDLFWS